MSRKPRRRKRHLQLEMLDASGTKKKSNRGGKRRGAGRKPKGRRAGSPHKRREEVRPNTPVHVTLRLVVGIASLRKRKLYRALREATIAVFECEGFHIVHLSIQRDHVHLLVEAANKERLARGVQGFEISAAKHINGALGRRRGQVFADRYHPEIIKSPRQARHALAYVLNNWRKHHEDRQPFAHAWKVDPFSTAWAFEGWKGRERELFYPKVPDTYEPLVVWFAKSWLLREGWRRHGLISFEEVPSARLSALRARRAERVGRGGSPHAT